MSRSFHVSSRLSARYGPASSRSACSEADIRTRRKMKAFDKETESMVLNLRKKHQEELRNFESDWIMNNTDGNDAMAIRDIDARQSVMETQRETQKSKNRSLSKIIKKQKQEMDQTMNNRARERKLVMQDIEAQSQLPLYSQSEPSLVERSLATSRLRTATTKPILARTDGSFRVGRKSCIAMPENVRVGRFRRNPCEAEDDDVGDLLDMDNLDRILRARDADNRHQRYERDVHFTRQFADETQTQITRRDNERAVKRIVVGETQRQMSFPREMIQIGAKSG